MIKSRKANIALAVLGAAAIAATALEKVPKYAAIGGGILMFIADIKRILGVTETP